MNAKWLRGAKRGEATSKPKASRSGKGLQYVHTTLGVIVSAVVLMGCMVSYGYAQSYPDKPIRFIMPNAPGGVHDIAGRIVSKKITEHLGQPLVVEFRGGAGGNLAYELVASSHPDGYTIVLGSGALTTAPSIYKKLNYKPLTDLVPVSLNANVPAIVVVNASQPFKTLKELLAYAKANPRKLRFGSSGIGTSNHLTGELLGVLAKVELMHVPYKGAGPALTALMSDEIQIMTTAFSSTLPHINAGRFRALAICSKERVPSLPDVPTAKEAGLDDFEVSNWYGILAPAGTPRNIINRLNGAWVKSAAMPDTRELMQKVGLETLSSTPEEMGEFLRSETLRWAHVIKTSNISKLN